MRYSKTLLAAPGCLGKSPGVIGISHLHLLELTFRDATAVDAFRNGARHYQNISAVFQKMKRISHYFDQEGTNAEKFFSTCHGIIKIVDPGQIFMEKMVMSVHNFFLESFAGIVYLISVPVIVRNP